MIEKKAFTINGFVGILLLIFLVGAAIFSALHMYYLSTGLFALAGLFIFTGITIVQPNQAKVITFFGKYMGTIRESGLYLTIPLTSRKTVSLRVRNFNSKKLKVNDVEGNPIEIAAVVVFKVVDSAKAVFEVDNYEEFVEIQSETAIRHVAGKYPYDTFTDEEVTLRGDSDTVSEELARNIQERLAVSGVEVLEARLTHLAYSTEIASAMLQRQQASAILSARQKIVEGAVSMAQMAVEQLQENGTLDLDEERKVNMVNNIMVAIISDRGTQPVVNVGSLY
ncbi:SPFH domain-containing protein [Bacillus andreraoultii]|uniref:SPFH domain-containing protein n=1 Tax=Bacillus andreraoultii TaxID=1499685 RepID=UPI00053AB27D|nr:SPFH domain-containing protein [Bacillus andreraoultii]